MVADGFRRVTPTHVRALTKRYQRALGELRYAQQAGLAEAVAALTRITESLGHALRLCAPDINVTALRPIRFRPPEPIDDAVLTRAVLASLRAQPEGIDAVGIAAALALQHGLPEDTAEHTRLIARVRRKLAHLSKRGFVVRTAGRWHIA